MRIKQEIIQSPQLTLEYELEASLSNIKEICLDKKIDDNRLVENLVWIFDNLNTDPGMIKKEDGSERIKSSIRIARDIHIDEYRDVGGEPFLVHPTEAAFILGFDGMSSTQIDIALLHDGLEHLLMKLKTKEEKIAKLPHFLNEIYDSIRKYPDRDLIMYGIYMRTKGISEYDSGRKMFKKLSVKAISHIIRYNIGTRLGVGKFLEMMEKSVEASDNISNQYTVIDLPGKLGETAMERRIRILNSKKGKIESAKQVDKYYRTKFKLGPYLANLIDNNEKELNLKTLNYLDSINLL